MSYAEVTKDWEAQHPGGSEVQSVCVRRGDRSGVLSAPPTAAHTMGVGPQGEGVRASGGTAGGEGDSGPPKAALGVGTGGSPTAATWKDARDERQWLVLWYRTWGGGPCRGPEICELRENPPNIYCKNAPILLMYIYCIFSNKPTATRLTSLLSNNSNGSRQL